jgi:hypothetical protein
MPSAHNKKHRIRFKVAKIAKAPSFQVATLRAFCVIFGFEAAEAMRQPHEPIAIGLKSIAANPLM